MPNYEGFNEFCMENAPNKFLEKSENPNLDTVLTEAIYNTFFEMHSMDKKCKRKANNPSENENSSGPPKMQDMGSDSECILHQIQVLNSAIRKLHLDISHILQEMIHPKINTKKNKGIFSPDFQADSIAENDKNCPQKINIKKDADNRINLEKVSNYEEGELEKTNGCICSILATVTNISKKIEPSDIAKCLRCHGVQTAQYVMDIVILAIALLSSLKSSLELTKESFQQPPNRQDSQFFRTIPIVLQDPSHPVTEFKCEENRTGLNESITSQQSNEICSDSNERESGKVLIICNSKKNTNMIQRDCEGNKLVICSNEINLKNISEDKITKLLKTKQSSEKQNDRVFDFRPFHLELQKSDDTVSTQSVRTQSNEDVNNVTMNPSPSELTLEETTASSLQTSDRGNHSITENAVKKCQEVVGNTILKCDTWIRDHWIMPKLLDSKIKTLYQENDTIVNVVTIPKMLFCHFKCRQSKIPHTKKKSWKYFALKKQNNLFK